jgi:hypothetical protein
MAMFDDALEMELELTIGGQKFKVRGANIKSLRINLYPYGFKTRLSFWVSSETDRDKLFDPFVKHDLIEVLLKVEPHFKPKENEIESLDLKGFVTGKAVLNELTIENIHLKGQPVLYRHYRIDFADPARVLWGQHFPCDLLVDKSVKNLIEDNKATGVTVNYDWPALDDTFAINTLPLGVYEKGASFYDFIVWYTACQNGVLTYDSKENEYTLSDAKDQKGQATEMSKLEVERHVIDFPATIRYTGRLLNAYSEDPRRQDITQSQSKEGVWRDLLLRLPIASDFEKAYRLESDKQKIKSHEIHLTHRRFPQLTYRPGELVKIEGGLWSEKLFTKGKEYRVRDILIRAQAVNDAPDADHNMTYSRYTIDMRSRLEQKDEATVSLPPFKAPPFPIYVEGTIVSEQGQEEEETYQIYEHPQTALDQYKVKVPLFENQQVVAPFEPTFLPGQFYFPAYKGQRVLLLFDFHAARIVRFLDWRAGCRLPMDTQGDHLLLGKTLRSNTSINHVYVDNKPQLNVKRTSDSDTEKIHLHEGVIVLETKEEES